MSRRLLIWILLGISTVGLLSVATFDSSGPVGQEERIQHLSSVYACPQCDGQSVAESNAAVAVEIRDFIRIGVSNGSTDKQIRDELVRSYGTEVLLTPPAEGVSLLIWILPVVAVVGGGALVVVSLRRRKGSLRTATDADSELVASARNE